MNNAEFLRQGLLARRQEELSAVAFHAVLAQAGGALLPSSRNADAMGVDVSCCFQGVFSPRISGLTSTSLHVQLKSTRSPVSVEKRGAEYWRLDVPVEKLRRYMSWNFELILALFVLPSERDERAWVTVDRDGVTLRKSLYWTSLVGFPLDDAKPTNALFIPQTSLLTPDALRGVVASKVEGKGAR